MNLETIKIWLSGQIIALTARMQEFERKQQ